MTWKKSRPRFVRRLSLPRPRPQLYGHQKAARGPRARPRASGAGERPDADKLWDNGTIRGIPDWDARVLRYWTLGPRPLARRYDGSKRPECIQKIPLELLQRQQRRRWRRQLVAGGASGQVRRRMRSSRGTLVVVFVFVFVTVFSWSLFILVVVMAFSRATPYRCLADFSSLFSSPPCENCSGLIQTFRPCRPVRPISARCLDRPSTDISARAACGRNPEVYPILLKRGPRRSRPWASTRGIRCRTGSRFS